MKIGGKDSDDSSDSDDDSESDDSSDSEDEDCDEQSRYASSFAGAMALWSTPVASMTDSFKSSASNMSAIKEKEEEEIFPTATLSRDAPVKTIEKNEVVQPLSDGTTVNSDPKASPPPRTDMYGHPLNAYEQKRIDRMIRNEERLRKLGLLQKKKEKPPKKRREKKNYGPRVRSSGRLSRHNEQGGDNKDNVSLGHDPPLLSEGHESSSPSRNSSNINTKSSNGKEKKMNGVVGGDEQCLQKLSSKTAVTKVKSPKSLVVDEDEEGVYNVKKILKCEKNGNKNPEYSPDIMVFKVQWVGYPATETTWEPKENLIGAAGEYISSMFGEACVIYLIFSEI